MVSVCAGEGLENVFRDLGVDALICGGQTMNPSTDDILAAIDAVNADTVFILPNNKNIFLVAERAAEMTQDKKIVVIHSAQFTQGFTAMMTYDETATPEENAANMEASLAGVTTLSFTRAVRDADIDGMNIKDGEILGLVNGKVKSANVELAEALKPLLAMIGEPTFLSVYYGADATPEGIALVEQMLTECAPDAEIAVLEGGQPLYDLIISVE